MTPDEMIAYWTKSASDDWRTTRHLFEKRDYVESLFFGHLYIEKLLKALAVKRTRTTAPWGHWLVKLAEAAELELNADEAEFLERVSQYYISTRYPDWQFEFRKLCTRKYCSIELKEIERLGKWLQQMLKH